MGLSNFYDTKYPEFPSEEILLFSMALGFRAGQKPKAPNRLILFAETTDLLLLHLRQYQNARGFVFLEIDLWPNRRQLAIQIQLLKKLFYAAN